MEQLDQFAVACVNSVQQSPPLQTEPCLAFNEALNGELLTTYIYACREVKSWRDQYVSSQINSPEPDPDANETLELMIEIEFLCGEDALLKRTEFIAIAYQQLSNPSSIGLAIPNGVNQDIKEFRQDLLITRERARLTNSFQQLQLRQRQETQRQIDRQELELIRQQNVPVNRR